MRKDSKTKTIVAVRIDKVTELFSFPSLKSAEEFAAGVEKKFAGSEAIVGSTIKEGDVTVTLSADEIVVLITALRNDTDSRREDNSFLDRQCQSEAKLKRDNLAMMEKNRALCEKLEKA